MTALRVCLCSLCFAVLGACSVEPPPASPDEGEVSSSVLDPGGGALPSSLQTCIKSCNPDDEACLDCCHCLAHGGSPQQCCF